MSGTAFFRLDSFLKESKPHWGKKIFKKSETILAPRQEILTMHEKAWLANKSTGKQEDGGATKSQHSCDSWWVVRPEVGPPAGLHKFHAV